MIVINGEWTDLYIVKIKETHPIGYSRRGNQEVTHWRYLVETNDGQTRTLYTEGYAELDENGDYQLSSSWIYDNTFPYIQHRYEEKEQ